MEDGSEPGRARGGVRELFSMFPRYPRRHSTGVDRSKPCRPRGGGWRRERAPVWKHLHMGVVEKNVQKSTTFRELFSMFRRDFRGILEV